MKNSIKDTFESFSPSEEQKAGIYKSIIEKRESNDVKAGLSFNAKLRFATAACIIIGVLAVMLLGNQSGDNNVILDRPGNTYRADTPATNSALPVDTNKNNAFSGFVLTAYSARGQASHLSANYEDENEKAVLTPDVKVLLAKYTPAMSSVPGLPFTVDLTGENNDIEAITVSANGGGLCKWDRDTGVVSPEGYTTSIGKGETIYWSPVGGEASSSVKQITITVEAVAGDAVIGRQNIYINQDERGYYYATVGKLELV